jgi:hypothetical protein
MNKESGRRRAKESQGSKARTEKEKEKKGKIFIARTKCAEVTRSRMGKNGPSVSSTKVGVHFPTLQRPTLFYKSALEGKRKGHAILVGVKGTRYFCRGDNWESCQDFTIHLRY